MSQRVNSFHLSSLLLPHGRVVYAAQIDRAVAGVQIDLAAAATDAPMTHAPHFVAVIGRSGQPIVDD